MFDVPNFRTDERDRVMADIIEMTRRRFKLARHFRDTRPWEFSDAGGDGHRPLHDYFWASRQDPPGTVPGNPYEQAFRDYYKMVDAEMGPDRGPG